MMSAKEFMEWVKNELPSYLVGDNIRDEGTFRERYDRMCRRLDRMTPEYRKKYFEKQFKKYENDPNTWGNILGEAGLLDHLHPQAVEDRLNKELRKDPDCEIEVQTSKFIKEWE